MGPRRVRCCLTLTSGLQYFCTGFPEANLVPKCLQSKRIVFCRQLLHSGYPIRNTFERKPRLMLDPCSGEGEDSIGGAEIRGTDSEKQG